MMAKRRAARHDPLEMGFPTAHCPIGGIDYKTGWSLLGFGESPPSAQSVLADFPSRGAINVRSVSSF
jgi:hypothetical protein